MADVVLSQAQYGKAEVRVLHVDRGAQQHEITDLNVSVALAGGLTDTYLTGHNAGVLTTDAQKNTVYAFARKFGVRPVEEFGLRLASHFAGIEPVERARCGSSSTAGGASMWTARPMSTPLNARPGPALP